MNNDYINIAKRLKQFRLNKQLSLQDLADLTGLSKSTLQRYETGDIENIPLSKIDCLSKGLGVTPHEIMGWEINDTQSQPSPRLSEHEQEIILQYRCLDVRGKYAIDTTLQREYEFYLSEQRNSVSGA